jgi:hypothetical protein
MVTFIENLIDFECIFTDSVGFSIALPSYRSVPTALCVFFDGSSIFVMRSQRLFAKPAPQASFCTVPAPFSAWRSMTLCCLSCVLPHVRSGWHSRSHPIVWQTSMPVTGTVWCRPCSEDVIAKNWSRHEHSTKHINKCAAYVSPNHCLCALLTCSCALPRYAALMLGIINRQEDVYK